MRVVADPHQCGNESHCNPGYLHRCDTVHSQSKNCVSGGLDTTIGVCGEEPRETRYRNICRYWLICECIDFQRQCGGCAIFGGAVAGGWAGVRWRGDADGRRGCGGRSGPRWSGRRWSGGGLRAGRRRPDHPGRSRGAGRASSRPSTPGADRPDSTDPRSASADTSGGTGAGRGRGGEPGGRCADRRHRRPDRVGRRHQIAPRKGPASICLRALFYAVSIGGYRCPIFCAELLYVRHHNALCS